MIEIYAKLWWLIDGLNPNLKTVKYELCDFLVEQFQNKIENVIPYHPDVKILPRNKNGN